MDAAQVSLLEHGELTAEWVAAFHTHVSAIIERPSQHTFDRKSFASLHLVSLYFPIRLCVHGSPTAESVATLSAVHSRAEEALWRHFLSMDADSSCRAEAELVDLVFGEARPALSSALDPAWGVAVATAAKTLVPDWRARSAQPLWPSMAAHFASFFLDFHFTCAGALGTVAIPTWVDSLRETTSHPLADALTVLRVWFSHYAYPLDSSGIPRYRPQPRRGVPRRLPRHVVPRGALEYLLLA